MHRSTCLPRITIWSNEKVEQLQQKIMQSNQMMDRYKRRLESFEKTKTDSKKRKVTPKDSDYWIKTFGLPT